MPTKLNHGTLAKPAGSPARTALLRRFCRLVLSQDSFPCLVTLCHNGACVCESDHIHQPEQSSTHCNNEKKLKASESTANIRFVGNSRTSNRDDDVGHAKYSEYLLRSANQADTDTQADLRCAQSSLLQLFQNLEALAELTNIYPHSAQSSNIHCSHVSQSDPSPVSCPENCSMSPVFRRGLISVSSLRSTNYLDIGRDSRCKYSH